MLGLSLLPLAGCPRVAVEPTRAGSHLSKQAVVTLAHGDGRVGTYVSKAWGFTTSSYWIEGPDGLIRIDTQFLESAADKFVT